jgi:hypothetical protein
MLFSVSGLPAFRLHICENLRRVKIIATKFLSAISRLLAQNSISFLVDSLHSSLHKLYNSTIYVADASRLTLRMYKCAGKAKYSRVLSFARCCRGNSDDQTVADRDVTRVCYTLTRDILRGY